MKAYAHFATTLVLTLLAGCAGGGSSPAPAVSAQQSHTAAKSAQVTFTMHWNSATTASSARAPKFISPSALSVSVTVNGGTPSYLNAPVTTLTIVAPVGNDTFAFQTYDETNGQGNVLGRASVTENIVDGAANVVSAVINGIPASLTIGLEVVRPLAGTSMFIPVFVSALDADGNVIVGPGYYAAPINLAINDPTNTGTLSLSATSLQGPASTATVYYNGGTLVSASVVASMTGVPSVSATITPTPAFYSFSIPTMSSNPEYIAAGPDGNMWFTEYNGNNIGRITPAGVVHEFPLPEAGSGPAGITAGSDGRIWFTEQLGNNIAAITTTGSIEEYSLGDHDGPQSLIDRLDGTIWATGYNGNDFDVVQMCCGNPQSVTVPTPSSHPLGIATASDNNVYITEFATNKIARVSNLGGAVYEAALGSVGPYLIVRGPDGNLWFTEYYASKIGQFSPSSFSQIGEFPTLTPNATPAGIAVGVDGALWFTENTADKIGRITTTGAVTEYASPVRGLQLNGIAVAPNGSLWFTEAGVNKIGELVY